jgi:hypothetical protein
MSTKLHLHLHLHLIAGSFFVLASALYAAPASADHADHGFAPAPPVEAGGKPSGVSLRILKYDGATNGALSVEVQNTRAEPTQFSPRGLYFVPEGNANEAPQRLGAVGPFSVKTEHGWERRESITLAPGARAELRLDVYCIDSHRGSPSSSTGFRMAKERVPRKLADDITHDAEKATESLGGVAAPAAKSAVQSQVWKNRDKKWLKLEGEGAQEAAKSR